MEYTREDYPVRNRDILTSHINAVIPLPVKTLFSSFFQTILHTYRWIRFDGDIPPDLAVDLFLHWIVKYYSDRDYGMIFVLSFFLDGVISTLLEMYL
jgi:hypothetical protein